METIKININGKDFEFAWEILFRHMRKIQPLSDKQANWEINELDFMVEIAEILCEKWDDIKNAIDNLNMAWVEKFSKDFEKVMWVLQIEDETKKK